MPRIATSGRVAVANRNVLAVGQNLIATSEPQALGGLYSSNNVTVGAYAWPSEVGDTYAVSFGTNGIVRWAYQAFTPTDTTKVYTLSVYVQMNDNSQPVISSSGSGSDFQLVFCTAAVVGTATRVGSTNVYRCSYTGTLTIGGILFGVVKYAGNSAKTFKITGFQLEERNGVGPYVRTSGAAVTTPVRNYTTGRQVP